MIDRTPITGLTSTEVAERVSRGQTNNYNPRVSRSYWDIFRDNILNLFNMVMGVLLFTVLLFGDYATVVFAGFSVVTNAFLGAIQEAAAKRQLDKLAALSLADVRVYRDGEIKSIEMKDIVVDDLIPIEPGDRLPVDGVVVQSDALEMDESQLTGESDAVAKEVGAEVSSGSFVIAGSGIMRTTRVGKESTLNRLSDVAKQYKRVLTPTQDRLNLLVQLAVIVMAVCTPMIFVAGYLQIGEWINLFTFRNATIFVASIVPQGLVLTAILALTIGAINISRKQTLVQRVNAVESMANVTTLCFDKTGTLTRNKLSVTQIIPLVNLPQFQIEDDLRLYTGNLSNLNRTAAAIAKYLNGNDSSTPALPAITKTREVPFTSARKWGAVVLKERTLIMGAPERVLPKDAHGAREQAEALAAQGLRVLALAQVPEAMQDGALNEQRVGVALIVLSDEIREDIHGTLDAFHQQDVALKVISGDNLETVTEIASEAGLRVTGAYTGQDLDNLSDDALGSVVREANVFARVEPHTKRRIIRALKENGEYVAMVGDGVNDVPALKEAHLAIAMNDGAQIAKDIADIVLLNNAMTTLPLAFSEGRTITQTIFGTTKIFLVKVLWSLLFFMFAGFMFMPFPIGPIQISWMTFGIINVPATLIAFRIIKAKYMKRFRRDVLDYVVTAGFVGAASMALVYGATYLQTDSDLNHARSTVMIYMVLYGLICYWNIMGIEIFEPRTIRKNLRTFFIGLVLAIITIIVPFIVPQLIEFTPLRLREWGYLAAAFAGSVTMLYALTKTRSFSERLWRLLAP